MLSRRQHATSRTPNAGTQSLLQRVAMWMHDAWTTGEYIQMAAPRAMEVAEAEGRTVKTISAKDAAQLGPLVQCSTEASDSFVRAFQRRLP